MSVDTHGDPAYRLALQTREQHIRREKATSNICTAQVLPAVIASMYAVYHGPQGLTRIAQRVAHYTAILARGLQQMGYSISNATAFDAITVHTGAATDAIYAKALQSRANLRHRLKNHLGISLDETTTREDVQMLWCFFVKDGQPMPRWREAEAGADTLIPDALRRTSAFLTHPVFNTHHSETGMLRYIRALSDKDLALDRSMIPLGSCTMKLNATSEMLPVTWPAFAHIHPFAPADQLQGYAELDRQLRDWLCQATGYAAISLQPNAGSQGEYAGLLVIQAWHQSRGDTHRNICLIPSSAHGTNPASAQMAGMTVVVTACDAQGNVDMADLKAKCEQHSANLAAMMITYPSTHGVFEAQVKETVCAGAPARRPGLRGRRQHERAGRRGRAGRVRRRREPPEPAQDLLHPARRRGPGRGPGVRGRGPRPLPPRPCHGELRGAPCVGRGGAGRSPSPRWATPACCPSVGCTAA